MDSALRGNPRVLAVMGDKLIDGLAEHPDFQTVAAQLKRLFNRIHLTQLWKFIEHKQHGTGY